MELMDLNPLEGKYTEQSEFLKAIAHPVRLCILNGLKGKAGCNVNHMQECLSLPQSTISTHLAVLRSVGAISSRREGKEVRYSVENDRVIKIIELLGEEDL